MPDAGNNHYHSLDKNQCKLHGALAMIPATSRKMHYEEVPSDLGAAFTFREFNWPSFPFNWHYHPEVELTLIVRARGMRFVGDSVEEFSDGDICLLGSNTPHCWASHKDAEPGVRSLVIQFRPESWGEAFWNLPELRGIGRLLREAKQGLEVRGRCSTGSRAIVPGTRATASGVLAAFRYATGNAALYLAKQ